MWSDSTFPETYNLGYTGPSTAVEDAVESLQKGEPVLIHDANDRENEVDLVYPAQAVTPWDVARLRNDAGGLICVALGYEVAQAFGLPFASESISHPAAKDVTLGYDDRSSFSLTVNHESTNTGIADNDRARTISELGKLARDPNGTTFAEEFDMPGHVHLLKAAPNLLDDRQGHTELGIALAEHADLPPAVVVCEMLDDRTGGPLSQSHASAYANENGFVFLDTSTMIEEVS